MGRLLQFIEMSEPSLSALAVQRRCRGLGFSKPGSGHDKKKGKYAHRTLLRHCEPSIGARVQIGLEWHCAVVGSGRFEVQKRIRGDFMLSQKGEALLILDRPQGFKLTKGTEISGIGGIHTFHNGLQFDRLNSAVLTTKILPPLLLSGGSCFFEYVSG